MANRNLKDFSDYVGKEFGYLMVTKVLPRRKDDKGLTVPVEMECVCRACGNTLTMRLHSLQSRTSCGCMPKKRNLLDAADALKATGEDVKLFAECSRVPYIIRKLHAKYICETPDEDCLRSQVAQLCCRECDKRNNCGMACKCTPDKCGAKKRKNEDGKDGQRVFKKS